MNETSLADFLKLVDIYIHKAGFSPTSRGQYCTTSRRRIRIRALPDGADPSSCDPDIWLIRYEQSAPRDQIPTQRVRPDQDAMELWRQRLSLLQYGQLARKDFMFNDKSNYPVIPNPAQAGAPHMNAHYQTANPFVHGAMMQNDLQPASKRQRTNGAATYGDRNSTQERRSTVHEEELGDLIDVLTPRDISQQRFMQHHEWMEEVFASPYATSKIDPVALGLGRAGELKPLTDGFFDRPKRRPKEVKASLRQEDGKEVRQKDVKGPFVDIEMATKLEESRFDNFTKRVTDKLTDIERDMEQMKQAHNKRMSLLASGTQLRDAEQRLRNAQWGSRPASSDSISPNTGMETVDHIVQVVESGLQSCVRPLGSFRCVEKGGFEEQASPPIQPGDNDVDMDETVTQPEATGDMQLTQAATGMSTPSFDVGENALASVSEATPSESLAPVPAADLTKAGNSGGEAEDWVVVEKQDPPTAMGAGAAAGTGPDSSSATPVRAGEDLGADILDFGVDAMVDTSTADDVFTGGAFDEAIEFTDGAGSLMATMDDTTIPDQPTASSEADATGAVGDPTRILNSGEVGGGGLELIQAGLETSSLPGFPGASGGSQDESGAMPFKLESAQE